MEYVVLASIAGLGVGAALGVITVNLTTTKALITTLSKALEDIKQMRYKGFAAELPMPDRPKSVPPIRIRED